MITAAILLLELTSSVCIKIQPQEGCVCVSVYLNSICTDVGFCRARNLGFVSSLSHFSCMHLVNSLIGKTMVSTYLKKDDDCHLKMLQNILLNDKFLYWNQLTLACKSLTCASFCNSSLVASHWQLEGSLGVSIHTMKTNKTYHHPLLRSSFNTTEWQIICIQWSIVFLKLSLIHLNNSCIWDHL